VGIPIPATILDLRKNELKAALIVGLGGLKGMRQEVCAEQSLGKQSKKFAAIHIYFKTVRAAPLQMLHVLCASCKNTSRLDRHTRESGYPGQFGGTNLDSACAGMTGLGEHDIEVILPFILCGRA
jgi:hypothetical protein